MQSLLRVFVLTVLLGCAPAIAGESVSISGRVVGVLQYPKTNTICMSFVSKDKNPYFICDNVTSKDIIEQLFALGKQDANCRIQGSVSKKEKDGVYLAITTVSPEK